MNILIDGQSKEIEDTGTGMESLLKSVLKVCADDRRVVTGVRVNGEDLPEFEGPGLETINTSEIETVEVETQPIDEVAHNILRTSAESIPQLIDEFSLVNQELQSRNVESGLKRTENAISFWISIVEGCLKAIMILQKDLDAIQVTVSDSRGDSTQTGNEVLRKINSLLEDTQTAFENQDNLEIGDIFEYDLPPLLRSFQQVLYQLAEEG